MLGVRGVWDTLLAHTCPHTREAPYLASFGAHDIEIMTTHKAVSGNEGQVKVRSCMFQSTPDASE